MKKPKIALGGAGFYIVLLLCLMVAGVSGYVMLFGHNAAEKEARAQAASAQTEPADAQVFADLDPAGPSLEILDPQTEKPAEDETLPADAPAELPAPETDPAPVEAVAPNLIVWPLRGEVVAAFSADALSYDATMGDWRTHTGLDLAADLGTQVMAACAGTVRSVEEDPMMGTTVVIDHPGGCCTTYANLQTVPAVKAGDSVSAGQIIGAVGSTAMAEAALAPHLHFAVEKDGDAVDPQSFLK